MTSTAQFCISWVSYKNCISKGFSRLQQNAEFVDMTLAAEGHLVKVHQNIVALSSPYLKAMIQSAPCPHPVIFLNNITQEILSFLLEYIYTGEVKIPTGSTPAFLEACKALHINGVEDLYLPKKPETQLHSRESDVEPVAVERPTEPLAPPDTNFAAHITINSDNFNVEVIPNENNTTLNQEQPIICLDNDLMNYQVITDAAIVENRNNSEQASFPTIPMVEEERDYEPLSSPITDREEIQDNTTYQNQENLTLNQIRPISHSTENVMSSIIGEKYKVQHYSISNRGSLQLLLNRFMYYCHHHSCRGRKRRWRCVDYRKLHCPAFIDTVNENIIKRSEVHSHSNHDTKILRKFKSKAVFTSLLEAEDSITVKPRKFKSRKRVLKKNDRINIVTTISEADGTRTRVHRTLSRQSIPPDSEDWTE